MVFGISASYPLKVIVERGGPELGEHLLTYERDITHRHHTSATKDSSPAL